MWKLRSARQCACCIFGCTLAKVIRGVAQNGFTNKVEFHHVVNSVKTKFQWNNKDFICFHGKWNSLAFLCLFSCHYPTTLLQSGPQRLADVRHGAQKHGCFRRLANGFQLTIVAGSIIKMGDVVGLSIDLLPQAWGPCLLCSLEGVLTGLPQSLGEGCICSLIS